MKKNNRVMNDYILKALRVKQEKIESFKHHDMLARHNLVLETTEASAQGYCKVRNTQTGRRLVISKAYHGKSAIYNIYTFVCDVSKSDHLDFLGYLNAPLRSFWKTHSRYNYRGKGAAPRQDATYCKSICDYYSRKQARKTSQDMVKSYTTDIERYEKEIADLQKKLASAIERRAAYQAALDAGV